VQQALLQLRQWGAADAVDEVFQGLVDRTGRLGGAGQAVEVGQDFRTVGVQLVVQLPATAQLAQKQGQSHHSRKRWS
jgi:hypothetical protein